ncbi:hypothetical protein [Blastococcus jejuensis]|uniref:hypothetical protein n=1 Tax=Blastococcus jejuensis TaxID=351224 RepID=UPI0031D06EDF
MIPTHWTPVHRPDDGEHVGYLAAESPDRAVPHLLVGAALGPARSREDAAALLRQHGLRALDRRWWCRLPDLLPGGLLPAGEPEPEWSWRPVVVVEASPEGCTVRPEWPAPEELTGRASLPTPVGDLLLEEPP